MRRTCNWEQEPDWGAVGARARDTGSGSEIKVWKYMHEEEKGHHLLAGKWGIGWHSYTELDALKDCPICEHGMRQPLSRHLGMWQGGYLYDLDPWVLTCSGTEESQCIQLHSAQSRAKWWHETQVVPREGKARSLWEDVFLYQKKKKIPWGFF